MSLSDVPQMLARITRIPVPYLLWALALAAAAFLFRYSINPRVQGLLGPAASRRLVAGLERGLQGLDLQFEAVARELVAPV